MDDRCPVSDMVFQRLSQAVDVPVELHNERLTTRMADRTGGTAASDSVAAAHLLESWLQARKAAR